MNPKIIGYKITYLIFSFFISFIIVFTIHKGFQKQDLITIPIFGILLFLIIDFSAKSNYQNKMENFLTEDFTNTGSKSVKQLLEEKCPLSISETRNGNFYINKTNEAVRDDYLFSGCKESNTCDTNNIDPVSNNILDNIPSKGHCGTWDLGNFYWDNSKKKWLEKNTTNNTPPDMISYPSSSSGIWAQDGMNEYSCQGAPGARTDISGWCIFRNENDAKNRCNSDPECIGYVSNSPDGFQLTKKQPVPNTVANGKFYKKTINTNNTPSKTVKELLDEKCPVSISENRNGTVYINPTNSAVRDDYLFSGCKYSNTCDTENIDPVSKNILDSIPSKGHCGAWLLGDYEWNNGNKVWTKKNSEIGTRKVKELLDEKCPLSISENRNGTVFINPTNYAVRDDYLFSGCKEANTCDTNNVDPVSRNILDNIPNKAHCGSWLLGNYEWDNGKKKWNDKTIKQEEISKTSSVKQVMQEEPYAKSSSSVKQVMQEEPYAKSSSSVKQVMQEEPYAKSSPEMRIMQEEPYAKSSPETYKKSSSVKNISRENKKPNESKLSSIPGIERNANDSKISSIQNSDKKANEAIYKQENRPNINKYLLDDGNKSIRNRNLRTKNPVNINISYNSNRPSTINDFDDKNKNKNNINNFRFDNWI